MGYINVTEEHNKMDLDKLKKVKFTRQVSDNIEVFQEFAVAEGTSDEQIEKDFEKWEHGN